jgi:hypothetical protein
LKPRNDDVKNACPYRRPHDGARTDMQRAFAQIDFRNIEREDVLADKVRAQGFWRIEERRIARGRRVWVSCALSSARDLL